MSALEIRDVVTADRPFLLATIRETLVANSAYYNRVHPAVITTLIEPVLITYRGLIAHPEGEPDTILGFILAEDQNTVGFIYVRNQFRRHNIASLLLSHASIQRGEIVCPFIVTKLNGQNFPRFVESKGYKLRFRPFIPLEIQANILLG
jgi:hypothetical protein